VIRSTASLLAIATHVGPTLMGVTDWIRLVSDAASSRVRIARRFEWATNPPHEFPRERSDYGAGVRSSGSPGRGLRLLGDSGASPQVRLDAI